MINTELREWILFNQPKIVKRVALRLYLYLMLPKISIIIVVRNAVTMLEKAISSVLQQHYPHLEFIIIDGGSTDGTVEVIKKYASQLAYWHSQPDGGAGVAQNMALEKATGDVVGFLFADDWYEPNTLKIIGETFAKNAHVDMVSCGSKIVVVNSQNGTYQVRCLFQGNALELNLKNILFGTPLIGARFIRRNFLNRVGNFHALDAQGKYNYSNDTEWLLRAVLCDAKNIVVNHLGYVYLAHDKSDTFSRNMQTVKRIRQEHVLMAETFLLRSDLTKQQEKILQMWHRDQLMRLMLCAIYLRDWNGSIEALKKSFSNYQLRMIDTFMKVLLMIIINRMRSKLKFLKFFLA